MENGKEYTADFINDAQNLADYLKNYILDENGNVNMLLASSYVRRTKLPKPRFSSQWVRSFMKRNRLSWRRGHYARRGNIDPEYVKRFMLKLARAITKYGYDYVFNVDETSVRISNSFTRTIAPVGLEQILINADVKEKECITAIGTCSRQKTYPFIIVTKGTTERSCAKFKIREDTEVWYSGT